VKTTYASDSRVGTGCCDIGETANAGLLRQWDQD
jgi:hypothetical protein